MIRITDRYRPFSHRPGEICMIPKSAWAVECFPAEIRFFSEEQSVLLKLDLHGPVTGFTVEQDLEKDEVRVFGRAQEGYFHFKIVHEEKRIILELKRGKSVSYNFAGKSGVLERHQFLEIETEQSFVQYHTERLSLGVNKKLDWEKVISRGDLKELLPLFFFIGQKEGPVDTDLILPKLDVVFIRNHFSHLLFPNRLADKRLGVASELPSYISWHAILYKIYEMIRSFFIEEAKGDVFLLPKVPAEFISGRIIGLKTKAAIFDIEWTKNKLRKVRITALESGPISIKWPKYVDSFRLKHRPQEKGVSIAPSDEILLLPGQIYYLDKFQK